MKQTKASILVVEDDPAILRGLLDVFVFNGYEAEGVEDGGEGLSRALGGSYDLIVLDVMLPTMDGFTVCTELRKHKPSQAVLMLTAKGSENDIVTGFKAGADDYVPKPFSLRELMVRIEAVLRRAGKNLGDEKVEYLGMRFDAATLKASFGDEIADLTRREMDIIAFLHRHQERIVSKKELLEKVWGYADADIETRTVDIHIMKLRKKIAALNPAFTPDAPFIATIRGEGYRLLPEQEALA